MGSDVSILSKMPDQAMISSKTQTTSFVMNRILEYILKNVTMSDLISLASDEGCKEWIVIAEKKLKDLFKTMDLYPTSIFEKDTEGPIYFAKIKDLQEKSTKTPDIKATKDKYCKILAFFYIRLFQVVGALALSVQDSSLPLTDLMPEELKLEDTIKVKQQVAPFIPEKKKRFGLFGGAVDYPFMKHYLKPIEEGRYNFTTFLTKKRIGNSERFEDIGGITYPGIIVKSSEDSYKFDVQRRGNSVTFDFYIKDSKIIIDNIYKNATQFKAFILSDIYAEQTSGQVIVGDNNKDLADYINDAINTIVDSESSAIVNLFKKLGYLKKFDDNTYRIVDTHINLTVKESQKEEPTFLYAVETTVNNKKLSIDLEFKLLLTKLEDNSYQLLISNLITKSKSYDVPALEKTQFTFKLDKGELLFDDDSDPELKRNKQSIPRFLESQFNKLSDKIVESVTYGYSKMREGYVRPIANVKSTSSLKYTELWETLQKSPPIKSFCVARALQLLNLTGLSQQVPKAILPLIYKSKFEYIENKSLPMPGRPIVESAPFKALAQLYVSAKDIPSLGIDAKYLPEDKTKDTSLLKLLTSFEQNNILIGQILEKDKDSNYQFGTVTDKAKISALRYQARQLFQIQFNHTNNVLKFIKKIFNIKGPVIEFNQSIAQKGLRGIEEIAQEARDLLTDYYSKCQSEFAIGVKVLTNKQIAPPPQNLI